MMGRIEDLRKRRDELLRKAKARESMEQVTRDRKTEEKKLNAEIRALKNPGSIRARKSVRKLSGKLGGFIARRAKIVSENFERMEREEKKSKSRKRVRRKTTRRRVRR